MEQKTLALALGGGGARGLAHIGVVKVLQDAGIRIDYLAGTSFGGIVGAALASGKSIAEIEDFALHFSQFREMMKLMDLTTHRRGLFHGEKIRKFLANWLGEDLTFESLRIPLVMNAVNLSTGQEVALHEGPVMPALFSTMCIPGVFSPVFYKDQWLVDGGVLNNVPVEPARMFNPQVVIGVDVQLNPALEPHWKTSSYKPRWPVPAPDFFLDFYRAMLIMISAQTEIRLKNSPPDLLLSPSMDPEITMFMGFPRAEEAIAAGEKATQQYLPEIIQLIQK